MATAGLLGRSEPLTRCFDVALLDLDGVVYVGPDAVPGVPEALDRVRAAGMRLAFVTNNAARTPQAVADHLSELGIAARAEEVVTSSQAAAHYLADRLPAGAAVLVVGTTGLIEALRERGLTPVERASDDVAAVVQGYSPDLSWRQLAEGCVAIRRGVPWVATNLDPTVPSPRGPLPGNGSLVAALRHATGVEPVTTGKPDPTMHRESVQRSGARAPIVVGDRLDTDIAGGNAAGCPSLLVLTGVTAPRELLSAAPHLRPSFLGHDAGALLLAQPAPELAASTASCGRWHARVDGGRLRLRSDGGDGGDGGDGDPTRHDADSAAGSAAGSELPSDALDALRALCAAAWAATDAADRAEGGEATSDWCVSADDDSAARLVDAWQLGQHTG